MALVKAHRMHGHLAAHLDPLGSAPPGDPALDPDRLIPQLTPELQSRIPARLLRLYCEGDSLLEVLPKLRATYCGTMAYEIEHISNHEQRVWLRNAIESGRYRRRSTPTRRRGSSIASPRPRASRRYLRRVFLGQKSFSLAGLDVMIPMLDEALELSAASGAKDVVLGMAHRGRLNVIAHTLGRPYEVILKEFEGERTLDAVTHDPEGGTGDVKYHYGSQGVRLTKHGEIKVLLASNPSHLEAVDPVVVGTARALQTGLDEPELSHDPTAAMALLIHGDAAFAGQGIVAETLNLMGLDGYSTGGTLHIVANNQIGFTTNPEQERSTRYSSDIAKGFDAPIIHVNADDPEGALAAIRLAMAYRAEFQRDVIVDVVGYRRFGHNEGDEPAYTQPLMYERIENHPTVRELYAKDLIDHGVVNDGEVAGDARRGRRPDQGRARRAAAGDLRRRDGPPPGAQARPRRRRRARDRDPARPARDAERPAPGRPPGLHGSSQAPVPARAPTRHARSRRRDRLGARRGVRAREPDRGRHTRASLGPGHGARHVRAPPPRPPRREDGRQVRADPASADAVAPLEVYNSPLSEQAVSASSTATRSRARTRSSSGRPSSATS